jgi:hypothetical protein
MRTIAKLVASIRKHLGGHCTWWPDSLLGYDYSLACWHHDIAYQGSWLDKIKGDFWLFVDVWAVAAIAPGWKRLILGANACLMYLGVSIFGWLPWLNHQVNRALDPRIV